MPSFGFDCSIGFCEFFMAAYNLLLPYSKQMFPKITENIYGTFLTAEAVGGLIGALISGRVNKNYQLTC